MAGQRQDPRLSAINSIFSVKQMLSAGLQLFPASYPVAGAPFGTAGHTSSVSLSADFKFALVPHYELANLEVFKVGSDGSFTAVPGSPFPGGNAASYAISDPANKFVFLLNPSGYNQSGTESISVYKLDDNSGTLTQVQGSPFGLTAEGAHLRIDPSGKFLYVVGDVLQGFSVDQNSGKLTALSGSPIGTKVADAAIVKQ